MQVRNPVADGASPLVSLVFPAYNPGTLVENTWQQIQAFRQWAPGDWEFVFVCDGCTDGTPERLRAMSRGAGDRVRILSYQLNRGKGHAVRLGLQEARGRYRIFTDIDLAYGFADITRLADALQAGAEVAIASRVHPESRILLPAHLLSYMFRRHLQSKVFSLLVRCILPVRVGDTQAGLKGLSARAAAAVVPRLSSCGFEFDCELLTACARLGINVTEVPVTVRYENSASTTGMTNTTRMVRQLLAIRRLWSDVPAPAPLAWHGQDVPEAEAANCEIVLTPRVRAASSSPHDPA